MILYTVMALVLIITVTALVVSSIALSDELRKVTPVVTFPVVSPTVTPGQRIHTLTQTGNFVIVQPSLNEFPSAPGFGTYTHTYLELPSLLVHSRDALMGQACQLTVPAQNLSGFNVTAISCPAVGYTVTTETVDAGANLPLYVFPVGGNPSVGFRGGGNQVRYVRSTNEHGSVWSSVVNVVTGTTAEGYTFLTLNNTPTAIVPTTTTSLRYVRSLDNNFDSTTAYDITTVDLNLDLAKAAVLSDGSPALVHGTTTGVRYHGCFVTLPTKDADWQAISYALPGSTSPDMGLEFQVLNGNPSACWVRSSDGLFYSRATEVNPDVAPAWPSSPSHIVDGSSSAHPPTGPCRMATVDVAGSPMPMVAWMGTLNAKAHVYVVVAKDLTGASWGSPLPVNPTDTQVHRSVEVLRLEDSGKVAVTYVSGTQQRYVLLDGNDPTNQGVVVVTEESYPSLGLGQITVSSEAQAQIMNVFSTVDSHIKYVTSPLAANPDFANNIHIHFQASGQVLM